jgi:beta-fructofuranosidase
MTPYLFCPTGQRLTDTFIFVHSGVYHAFSGIAPADRPWDWGASYMEIGHFVSTNLINWQQRPVAVRPGNVDEFDAVGVNVGCVIEYNDGFYLFYWCWNKKGPDRVPRIGMAFSRDLDNWSRPMSAPALEADRRWYEDSPLPDDKNGRYGSGVRDPFVFYNDAHRQFHMIFAGRTRSGPLDGRGCIGHAVSDDLCKWQALPPLLAPGYYSEMEVPQIFQLDKKWYIWFHSNLCIWLSELGRKELPSHEQIPATFYWSADDCLGPFRRLEEHMIGGNEPHVAIPLVLRMFLDLQNRPALMHFILGKTGSSDQGAEEPASLALPKTLYTDAQGLLRSGIHQQVAARSQPPFFKLDFARQNIAQAASASVPDCFIAELDFDLGQSGSAGFLLWTGPAPADTEGYRLILDQAQSAIELRRACDRTLIARRPFAKIAPGHYNLKLVVCNECIDIYLDDIWALTAVAYHRTARNVSYWKGGAGTNINAMILRAFSM